MKKVLFVIMALCFVSTLALAADMVKPADDKAMKAKPAATSTGVVMSDETTTTEKTVATSMVKDESMPAVKDADTKKVDPTAQKKAY
ncbi:hypothetical protein EPN54_02700 [bacterium]|nr:MAG: hypothetical protein EPN54_02700 [bacterium]